MDTKDLIPTGGNIRKTDDELFSVIDAIQNLTGRTGKRASDVLARIESTSPDVSANLRKHKFQGQGQRFTPVADKETLLKIFMLLPGLVGDKIRKESAVLVLRTIDADITLADEIIQRNNNQKDLEWVAVRTQGKVTRNKFTSSLARHGVNKDGYRDCTNAIYIPLWGGGAATVRAKVGVPEKANPRDRMNTFELNAVMLAESGAETIIEGQNRHGNTECENACFQSSSVIAEAVKKINAMARA